MNGRERVALGLVGVAALIVISLGIGGIINAFQGGGAPSEAVTTMVATLGGAAIGGASVYLGMRSDDGTSPRVEQAGEGAATPEPPAVEEATIPRPREEDFVADDDF